MKPLASVPPGKSADRRETGPESASLLDMPCDCGLRVEELIGGPSLRSRLYAMGILPGTEMELRDRPCGDGGNVCVNVRQCSLVLGESLARAIVCSPVHTSGMERS
jgi:ferrous iron transport protein A